jgi:hypothetical protein
MTGKNIWRLCKVYGRLIGYPELKPHDYSTAWRWTGSSSSTLSSRSTHCPATHRSIRRRPARAFDRRSSNAPVSFYGEQVTRMLGNEHEADRNGSRDGDGTSNQYSVAHGRAQKARRS